MIIVVLVLLLATHWEFRIAAAAEERREEVKGVTGGEEAGRTRSAVEEQNGDGNGSADEYGTGNSGFRQHGGGLGRQAGGETVGDCSEAE